MNAIIAAMIEHHLAAREMQLGPALTDIVTHEHLLMISLVLAGGDAELADERRIEIERAVEQIALGVDPDAVVAALLARTAPVGAR